MSEVTFFECDQDESCGVHLYAESTKAVDGAVVVIAVGVDDKFGAAYIGIRDAKKLADFILDCIGKEVG